MENQAHRFSGDAAENYEQYMGPFMFEPFAIDIASRINYSNPQNILELACGTGRVTTQISNQLKPGSRLVASDLNADMLEIAMKKLKGSNTEFQIADALELPFPDQSFDTVLCQFGFMFFPDQRKGLAEAFRVLKPGGTLLFNTWDKTENIPFLKLLFNDLLLPFFNAADPAHYLVPFSLHNPVLLKSMMNEEGFTDCSVERIVLKTQSSDATDLVTGYLLRHPVGKVINEKDPGALPVLANRFEKELIRQFGNLPLTCELAAFVGTGTRAS